MVTAQSLIPGELHVRLPNDGARSSTFTALASVTRSLQRSVKRIDLGAGRVRALDRVALATPRGHGHVR